ncbi:MAG: NAD(P)-dependent alcohol dehydrogenase [Saprospiraceae bacterium]|nr:NAD(P)-dependent alcohol dehydrogenase [Saprospiraceae bacterium]
MKAAIRRKYGPPDRLTIETIARPNPGDHEILVQVKAVTISRTDCAVQRGYPLAVRIFTGIFRPGRPIPGTDFAGIVVETGAKVTRFKTGDRVFGFDDTGLSSHAGYLTISENKAVLEMPANCSFETAAASMEGFHYALNFVNKVHFMPGQKVMLNGASGGIGSAMLQILQSRGAVITATARSEAFPALKALGATRLLDYEKEDFTRLDERFDYVFDAVGKSSFGRCRRLLVPKGVYISSELGRGWQNLFLALFTPIFGGKKVVFPVPFDIPGSLQTVKTMIEKGQFKPLIDRVFTLEKIIEAYVYVESGQKLGNVVVVMDEAG